MKKHQSKLTPHQKENSNKKPKKTFKQKDYLINKLKPSKKTNLKLLQLEVRVCVFKIHHNFINNNNNNRAKKHAKLKNLRIILRISFNKNSVYY